ncbi:MULTISPECIES: DUF5405 family protein [unclassified Serratia (in: enterobacteria)]|uniref:DUF5405 family protein n=1 Tax=unclassified Serratia (in: enterobacteria) TaxID=2647522 RepID=UPI000689D82E|nr:MULTISPECIES: DUF5405 family protein [unclassified Serratia (in: enterobacteria)]
MTDNNRVVINDCYAVIKLNDGDFILADVKKDKESHQVYYPTVAVYSNELRLTADIVNLCVKRGVFLRTITCIREVMSESHRIAELCQQALNQLNKTER